MNLIKPPRLKIGDTVGVCSPSGTVAHKRELFDRAVAHFEKATGLKTIVAPQALGKHHYSAGSLEERLADFHGLIGDPSVKAVLFSAGGDTAIDLLPHLDYDLIRVNPKIMAGISDATTILSAITTKTGLVTFLGFEFLDFATHEMPYTLTYLKKAWFEGFMGPILPNPHWHDLKQTHTTYTGWQTIRAGSAEGPLIGGNSESFIQLLGTEYELSLPGAILFLETYKQSKKQIHKTLRQIQLHGLFDIISGLIVGYCLDCDNPTVVGNEQSIHQLVLETTHEYSWPIMHVGEIGHCVENALQPLGARVRIDATNLQLEILESLAE